MSEFDTHWLDLREPADQRARDAGLLSAALELVDQQAFPRILDIGCGTGSTYRTLRERLQATVQWQLLDRDPRLLAEAERRHGADTVAFINGDLTELNLLPLEGTALVTASALFDLCSTSFIAGFAEHLRRARVGLYAALNYDGEISWSHKHPLDEQVVTAFNTHQQRDKGFGGAAGPNAWSILAAKFKEQGYRVLTAASPWILGPQQAPLQRLFLDGMKAAVAEEESLGSGDLEAWHAFRRDAIGSAESSCRVGHQDILALC